MNKRITNLTSSVLDLSVIKDLNGNPVTLRPANGPGCSREVAAEMACHDAVERCIDMKWVSCVVIAAASEVSEPAPVPVPVDTSAADAAAKAAAEAEAQRLAAEAEAKAAEEAAATKATEEAELQRLLDEEAAKAAAAVSEAPAEEAPADTSSTSRRRNR